MRDKVILVQPQNTLNSNIYPPLNLIKIGSVLESKGIHVKIITCAFEKNPIATVINEIQDSLFVGFGVLTPEMPNAIEIAKAIRSKSNIPLVWGGWHVSLFPEQTSESNLVDWVIVDEGDSLILKVLDIVKSGKGRNTKPFLKILSNEQKLDLNKQVLPNYSLVKGLESFMTALLADKFLEYDTRQVRWLPYESSRGCPGECAFCINVVTQNRRWRCKTPEKVIEEVKKIISLYHINHLKIIDDNFFVNTERVRKIARGFIESGIDITWDTECRADYISKEKINDEILELCVRAGLNEINFGIESGSDSTLKRMKKGVSPEQNYLAVKKASDHGIVCRCSFIIDIPEDTAKDIFQTVALINKIRTLPKTTCGVHTYRPYPKSELCEQLLKDKIIDQPDCLEKWAEEKYVAQFTYADANRTWQGNYKLSKKVSFYQNLESGFWLKPHQISNKLIRSINSFFMSLGKLRNKNLFYGFCIDLYVYKFFKKLFFKFWR
jgi:anaerobic magnesium-protoporphyrin IX monomethyl ester cyclase